MRGAGSALGRGACLPGRGSHAAAQSGALRGPSRPPGGCPHTQAGAWRSLQGLGPMWPQEGQATACRFPGQYPWDSRKYNRTRLRKAKTPRENPQPPPPVGGTQLASLEAETRPSSSRWLLGPSRPRAQLRLPCPQDGWRSPSGHEDTGDGRGGGRALPSGPVLGAASRWRMCPDPVPWTRARMQTRAGSGPRHSARFRGTQETGGHPIWGPHSGTLCPTNPEPSPGTVTQSAAQAPK